MGNVIDTTAVYRAAAVVKRDDGRRESKFKFPAVKTDNKVDGGRAPRNLEISTTDLIDAGGLGDTPFPCVGVSYPERGDWSECKNAETI